MQTGVIATDARVVKFTFCQRYLRASVGIFRSREIIGKGREWRQISDEYRSPTFPSHKLIDTFVFQNVTS